MVFPHHLYLVGYRSISTNRYVSHFLKLQAELVQLLQLLSVRAVGSNTAV